MNSACPACGPYVQGLQGRVAFEGFCDGCRPTPVYRVAVQLQPSESRIQLRPTVTQTQTGKNDTCDARMSQLLVGYL